MLRLTFAALCFSFVSGAAFAEPVEIQMLLNYRGVNKYDQKIVSTFKMPVSAFFVYVAPESTPTTAACFRGDPDQAVRLFRDMVEIFNLEYHHHLHVIGEPILDEGGEAALHIDAEENGHTFNWFESLGRCWRQSSAIERHPTS